MRREVFSLTFDHGGTQGKIGNLFDIITQAARRKSQSACVPLHDAWPIRPQPIKTAIRSMVQTV